MKTSTLVFLSSCSLLLNACGNRYFSPRSVNPLIEDRVRMGPSSADKMSVLTSRADRRTILIFGPGKVCAEPSPDVAEAISSQAIATLEAKDVKLSAGQSLQTAILQLTRRSQGLEFLRSTSFVYCMMHYNGAIERSEYLALMNRAFEQSVALTLSEIKNLPSIANSAAQISNPLNFQAKVVEPAESKP
ncbi:MAG: hypothetical protein ACKVOS_09455 [Sphingorhabdus sp.]|uniref:hypothetical protein n=1 Tax=Sphingorhabdus sp. TaxID=1902408 RepID=UPI0038FD38A4